MKRIIVTGAKGQLGAELLTILKSGVSELGNIPEELVGCELIPVDIDELDITNQQAVMSFICDVNPFAVINCAALTNVDGCEEKQDLALQVNALGARNLAMACEKSGSVLVQISTDYVFSGEGNKPYFEWELPAPQSVYGGTKRLGEEYVKGFCSRYFILRTAWLYGYYGNNFVKTIARLAKENGEVKVVNDQRGNPTNAADLAFAIVCLLATQEYGIYHCTGQGECSWYDFACKIVEYYQINAQIHPCTTEEFPRPAERPSYSALDHGMLRLTIGDVMRPWEDALACFCEKTKSQE